MRPGGVWGGGGEVIGLLSCLGGWEGPSQRSHSPEWLDKQVPRSAGPCHRLPLAPLMGTRVSMSRLLISRARGTLLLRKSLAKIKWSHLGTPPGESTELLPPLGRDQVLPGAGGPASGAQLPGGRGRAAGTGQRSPSSPSPAPLRPRGLGPLTWGREAGGRSFRAPVGRGEPGR